MIPNTSKQYDAVVARARDLFIRKMGDYGPSWRIFRLSSLTDQIYIKVKRIRTLQMEGKSAVGDDIWGEFTAIVNYGIMGLIQMELGISDSIDISRDKAIALYDKHIKATKDLMIAKNTDYGEAWREMMISSITDMIMTKVQRVKEIHRHEGRTTVSEGIDSNYQDMINYAIFALIRHDEGTDKD